MSSNAIVDLWNEPTGRSANLDELVDRRAADVPVDAIVTNPEQPRTEIDVDGEPFRELVDSIRAQGLLQPVVLRQPDRSKEEYVLIAGERRWRAVRFLSTESSRFNRIPATIVAFRTDTVDAEMLTRALAENVVRCDLSSAETATAICRLKELTGWSHDAIATHMGLTTSRVKALAAIARYEVVHTAVRDGEISQAQGIAIARATTDSDEAARLVEQSRGQNVATTKRAITSHKSKAHLGRPDNPAITPPPTVDVDALPIMRLAGRGEVARRAIEDAITATCSVLGWWPERSER